MRGRINIKTDCEDGETRKRMVSKERQKGSNARVARNEQHENGLRGRRHTKIYCEEGTRRNLIARNETQKNGLRGRRHTQTDWKEIQI